MLLIDSVERDPFFTQKDNAPCPCLLASRAMQNVLCLGAVAQPTLSGAAAGDPPMPLVSLFTAGHVLLQKDVRFPGDINMHILGEAESPARRAAGGGQEVAINCVFNVGSQTFQYLGLGKDGHLTSFRDVANIFAKSGTALFLDEVAELVRSTQARLREKNASIPVFPWMSFSPDQFRSRTGVVLTAARPGSSA